MAGFVICSLNQTNYLTSKHQNSLLPKRYLKKGATSQCIFVIGNHPIHFSYLQQVFATGKTLNIKHGNQSVFLKIWMTVKPKFIILVNAVANVDFIQLRQAVQGRIWFVRLGF